MKNAEVSLVVLSFLGTFTIAASNDASATVLCMRKPSGVVLARDTCKRKEARLDLAQLGATESQGP